MSIWFTSIFETLFCNLLEPSKSQGTTYLETIQKNQCSEWINQYDIFIAISLRHNDEKVAQMPIMLVHI